MFGKTLALCATFNIVILVIMLYIFCLSFVLIQFFMKELAEGSFGYFLPYVVKNWILARASSDIAKKVKKHFCYIKHYEKHKTNCVSWSLIIIRIGLMWIWLVLYFDSYYSSIVYLKLIIVYHVLWTIKRWVLLSRAFDLCGFCNEI